MCLHGSNFPFLLGRTGDQFKSEHRVSHLASEFTVNYRVTVTNTGKISGAVSVLAFVTSDVSA